MPSHDPSAVSARSLTDRGIRRERRLIDQILAAAPGMATRLHRARGLSDACLKGERQQNLRDLVRAQIAQDAHLAHVHETQGGTVAAERELRPVR